MYGLHLGGDNLVFGGNNTVFEIIAEYMCTSNFLLEVAIISSTSYVSYKGSVSRCKYSILKYTCGVAGNECVITHHRLKGQYDGDVQ